MSIRAISESLPQRIARVFGPMPYVQTSTDRAVKYAFTGLFNQSLLVSRNAQMSQNYDNCVICSDIQSWHCVLLFRHTVTLPQRSGGIDLMVFIAWIGENAAFAGLCGIAQADRITPPLQGFEPCNVHHLTDFHQRDYGVNQSYIGHRPLLQYLLPPNRGPPVCAPAIPSLRVTRTKKPRENW